MNLVFKFIPCEYLLLRLESFRLKIMIKNSQWIEKYIQKKETIGRQEVVSIDSKVVEQSHYSSVFPHLV